MMNLVTIQNIFGSWGFTLDKDGISGFGSLLYSKTFILLFSFEVFVSSLELLAYWFEAVTEYEE